MVWKCEAAHGRQLAALAGTPAAFSQSVFN